MSGRTLTTWALLVLVLLAGLFLAGGMPGGVTAESLAIPAPVHAGIAAGVDAANGAGAWRSDGPYGGAGWALAIPPAFDADGFALAGGGLAVHATTAQGVWHYDASCTEQFINGGFEANTGWLIKSNPVLAGYVTTPVHRGSRSMRTGIAAGGANKLSYSPIEQAVTFPAGLASATLSFWRYNVNGDAAGWQPNPAMLPRTEAEQPGDIQAADYFYALAILPNGTIDYLFTETANAPSWRSRSITLNVSRYAGKSIRFQFGTYNNGAGGISRTFVDDAALVFCRPEPTTPTPTPTPTPGSLAPRVYVPLLLKQPITIPPSTATPTATHTPTATPTATHTPIPTATPGFVPTPYWAGQLNLPVGSRPHGVAVNATGDRVFVAFHGIDHAGHTLGVINEYLTIQARIDLGPASQGPNGVAVIPASGRVVVANRQTANATVVDPTAGAVLQTLAAGLMPNGVIVEGGYGYIANFGSDTVTVFDPTTLAVIRTLYGVGHEPAMFASDSASGDVYLTAHGSNQVFMLRAGQVVGHWDGIPEPYGLSFDPASRRLYVANRGAHHTVTVIDVYLDSIVGTISLPKEPFVLLVNPGSGHLFIACGDRVEVYDTLDWRRITSIPAPPGAEEGIAFDPRLDKVFVTSRDSDALTVIQDEGPARVVFASNRDGNSEIYRMLPDGRDQVRLTFTADAWEGSPAGSPDGRWIAYERMDQGDPTYSQIWLMSRDGRGATMLTDGPFNNLHPTWSGDSRKIAFASDRDGDWEIYVLDLATRGLSKLTDNTRDDTQPDWYRAGGRIVFVSYRTPSNGELFTMAADGSDVQQVTGGYDDHSPSWSALGNRFVFGASRPEGQGLYTMRYDGTDIRLLAPQSLRPASPAWGYVGDTIAFSGYRPGSGHSEIMRIEADGSGLVLLTHNEVNFDYAPGWLAGR